MNQSKGNRQNAIPASITSIVQAIFVVNKHAKTALDPKHLYHLKRCSITKLLEEGKATKLGLHFSDNPRNSAQQSDLIIQCGDYIFHLPPSREDLKTLPHLGTRTGDVRNPKASMSLTKAKEILHDYTGIPRKPKTEDHSSSEKFARKNRKRSNAFQNNFPSTFLGKGFKY
jgi:hypothetical protein